tara:strand:- start:295 stop:1044 length:750 start_codon:yes stop_codon:yes gene_type:complete
MLNVDNIYIIHHTKLADRKTRLDASLRENNIRAEYIIEHDQEDLSDELISGNYECDEDLYNSKILPIYKSKFSSFKELSTAEISCTFKHRAAIEKIADATLGPLIGGESYGLILEDDAILCEDFSELFNEFLLRTPPYWDAIFIGCCSDLHVPHRRRAEGVVAYQMPHPASKGGVAYLLKKSAAAKITSTMKTFTAVSDVELAYQIHRHDLKTYWWEPPLVEQGSECGLYSPSLRDATMPVICAIKKLD